MLDLRHVVDHLEDVRAGLSRRSPAVAALLDPVATLASERRRWIAEAEKKQAERNVASKEMAKADKSSPEFAARRDELKTLSADVKALEARTAQCEAELEELLARIPNVPLPSVPDGSGDADNVVVKVWGAPPEQPFAVKPHYDVGVELGLLDFERATKIAGPRFTVLWADAARLERALIHFMLELHTREHGYTEVLPPFLVKGESLFGTGQLPKFEEDLFKTRKSDPERAFDLYLIPTAEVPVTNLHADEILDRAVLPLAYTAYTPCFRSEAGSYGQDVRGMIRQHQFDKIELVRVCEPEHSEAELELLTRHAETVLERLGLHYRRVALCAGDMGFSAAKTFDLEVWLPSQQKFREISSCSSFGDFQARRAKMRYRPQKGDKPRLLHTLNGSALAVGRTLIAILEQGQRSDGTVVIPEALRAFMGTDTLRPRVGGVR
ncbi:MAG: serine--tRNA ligase [Deltaproteobacteria bacterium]|nr:serine--tRNA ligase [Deltaproteobacteria bacterium]